MERIEEVITKTCVVNGNLKKPIWINNKYINREQRSEIALAIKKEIEKRGSAIRTATMQNAQRKTS